MGIATPHDVAVLKCNRHQNFGYYTNLWNALRTGRMHFGAFSESQDLRYWAWRNQDRIDGVIVIGDTTPTAIAFVDAQGETLATVDVHPTTIGVLEGFEAQHGAVAYLVDGECDIHDRMTIAQRVAASTVERASAHIPGFRLLHANGSLLTVVFK